LGDWGTLARIVDWDQLPNGLLGVTIQGEGRFDLHETETQSSGLVLGEVVYRDEPAPESMKDEWQPMLDVLQSLESHPHVQRMNLQLDYADAWQVAWGLTQLLPLEEYLKYELLGRDCIDEVMNELDLILNQISGED
jgi:Lon protease-like protein